MAAQNALTDGEYADKKTLELDTLKKLVKSDEVIKELTEASSAGKIDVWELPDKIFIVPSFSPPSHESPVEYIHVKDDNCPLSKCRQGKSKLHTLAKKEQPLCVHNILVHSTVQVQGSSKSSTKKVAVPKLDRDITTKIVMNQISEHFPSLTKMESTGFVKKSRRYIEKLFVNANVLNETILKQTLTRCTSCPQSLLEDWPFKPKQSFLFSLGHLMKIEIPLKFCRSCRAVFYPGIVECKSKGGVDLVDGHGILLISKSFNSTHFSVICNQNSLFF